MLVVLVVILFLQTWRASIIPLIAVPVSIVGTFAVAVAARLLDQHADLVRPGAGDRHRRRRRDRRRRERRAKHRAGLQPARSRAPGDARGSGPIIAIALVLCAVFVPMAFLSGVTGQFYKQFAVTIAISTVISAINSLTLSPALAAKLLAGRTSPKDRLHALSTRAFGWLFRPFNRFFQRQRARLQGLVRQVVRPARRVFVVYAVLLVGRPCAVSARCPAASSRTQDKLYLFAGAKLPEGASLDRTEAVTRRMGEIALQRRGCRRRACLCGLQRIAVRQHAEHRRRAYIILKPFDERTPQRRARSTAKSTPSLRRSRTASPTRCCRRPSRGWATVGLFAVPRGSRRAWAMARCRTR